MSVRLALALACVIKIQWLAVFHYLVGDATFRQRGGYSFYHLHFWATNQQGVSSISSGKRGIYPGTCLPSIVVVVCVSGSIVQVVFLVVRMGCEPA